MCTYANGVMCVHIPIVSEARMYQFVSRNVIMNLLMCQDNSLLAILIYICLHIFHDRISGIGKV